LAVKSAKTKYLAFIDSDAYPSEGWIENSLKFLKNKQIGIIAGPHIDPKFKILAKIL
jgi:cellulose synthase/poly-beta-1,6-N-acetylglucosamine synthase-like glycosyltransferase